MRAGDLDQRVTLESYTTTQDDWGQPIEGWTTFATVWAAVEPLRGREFIAAQAMTSELSARIRIRYRPGITGTMRVKHGSDTYGIEAVIHVKTGRQEVQLMCKKTI